MTRERGQLMWDGRLEYTRAADDGVEVGQLPLSDGTVLELWGEGLSIVGSTRMLEWGDLLALLRDRRIGA